MSIKKRVKRLENVKGKTTRVGVGTPTSLEGKNGDIHVRETPTGTPLFAKINGRWKKFSADPEPTPIIAAQESIDASGYMTFSNGLIIQWGKVLSDSTVTFPIAFPTACLNVVFGKITSDSSIPRYPE